MRKSQKIEVISELTEKFDKGNFFYVADSSALTVEQVNKLRGMCFKQDIELRVAKNTLIQKAMEASEKDFSGLYDILKGPTSLMFTEVSNSPAKLIEEFRKTHNKPVLKGAYIDSDFYIGDDQVEALANLKSKEELIGEIIGLLQSPAKNVIGALQSSGNKLAGIIKTLSERSEA